jgi:hypothetical protein
LGNTCKIEYDSKGLSSLNEQQLQQINADYSSNVVEEDGFFIMQGDFKITCRAVLCKNHFQCTHRINKSGVSSATAPSNDEEPYSEYIRPSNGVIAAELPIIGTGKAKATCGQFYKKICLEPHEPIELPKTIAHQKDLNGQCITNGVYVKTHVYTCYSPLCPICAPEKWLNRETNRMLDRFKAYDEEEDELGYPKHSRAGKQIHFVVSVAKNDYGLTLPKMRNNAMNYVKEVGFEGGAIVYHAYRKNPKKGMYYSPHFHMLGYGWIDGEKVNEVYEKHGYICKNLGLRNNLPKTIIYELGHASVPKNKAHVVTWFGSMGYRKIHVEKVHGEKEKCPICGCETQDGVYVGKEKNPLSEHDKEDNEYYLPREGWIYLPKWKNKDNLKDRKPKLKNWGDDEY